MTIKRTAAVLLGLMGLAWFLQGTGVFTLIPSVMNNDMRWAVYGALAVAAALWLWNWD